MGRTPRNDLSALKVRERLSYDPATGGFRWKAGFGRRMAGSLAGTRTGAGYIAISIGDRSYLAHRLAWLYVHGEWPKDQIDHIDGVVTNNRISNLRAASKFENARNKTRRGYNNTQIPGKFDAAIRVNGKLIRIGRYDSPDEARAAYLAATIKYFGEFSVTNRGGRE